MEKKLKREGGNRLRRAKKYVFDLIRQENEGVTAIQVKDQINIAVNGDIEMTVHFTDSEGTWKQTYKVPGDFRLPLLEEEEGSKDSLKSLDEEFSDFESKYLV